MTFDFEKLMTVRVVEYDREKARQAIEALVALCLDAQRQRALRAQRQREKADEKASRRA